MLWLSYQGKTDDDEEEWVHGQDWLVSNCRAPFLSMSVYKPLSVHVVLV